MEQIDQLASEIEAIKTLPLEQQPAAFEAIRLRLEEMIADKRSQENQ